MNNYIEIFSAVFVLLGSFLMLIAAIGILRLPDFYIRLSAVTKTSTIGIGLILLGAFIYLNNLTILLESIGILFFVILTSPASAHITAKAATHIKIPFWKHTNLEDYEKAPEMPDDPEKERRS